MVCLNHIISEPDTLQTVKIAGMTIVLQNTTVWHHAYGNKNQLTIYTFWHHCCQRLGTIGPQEHESPKNWNELISVIQKSKHVCMCYISYWGKFQISLLQLQATSWHFYFHSYCGWKNAHFLTNMINSLHDKFIHTDCSIAYNFSTRHMSQLRSPVLLHNEQNHFSATSNRTGLSK